MSKGKTTQEEKQFPAEVISLFEEDANIWYKKVTKTFEEKFAEYILENNGIYWLFSIGKITRWKITGKPRKDDYVRLYTVDHADTQTNDDPDPETHICKNIVAASRKGKKYEHIGTCIDYQTPMRNQLKEGRITV